MKKIAMLAGLAALACAGPKKEQKPVTVSDSDYGRLPAGQTQLVDSARADLGNARDGVARAKLRQTEARHEEELARADLSAVDADQKRADSMAKASKESNDPGQLERARAANEDVQLRRRAAEARLAYAKKLNEHRAADVEAAERRVGYEEARVEQSKLQALQQARVPAATKYQPGQLDERVVSARRDLEAAEGRARTLSAETANAERLWQELDRQVQARGGPPATRG